MRERERAREEPIAQEDSPVSGLHETFDIRRVWPLKPKHQRRQKTFTSVRPVCSLSSEKSSMFFSETEKMFIKPSLSVAADWTLQIISALLYVKGENCRVISNLFLMSKLQILIFFCHLFFLKNKAAFRQKHTKYR